MLRVEEDKIEIKGILQTFTVAAYSSCFRMSDTTFAQLASDAIGLAIVRFALQFCIHYDAAREFSRKREYLIAVTKGEISMIHHVMRLTCQNYS